MIPMLSVYICSITVAEITLGIALMPSGKKKQRLQLQISEMFQQDFAQRCLPFGKEAAIWYGQIVSIRQHIGRPITVEDAQIASIAMAFDLVLATRNTRDFEEISGLTLFNPWSP